jgi:hypothetical protein
MNRVIINGLRQMLCEAENDKQKRFTIHFKMEHDPKYKDVVVHLPTAGAVYRGAWETKRNLFYALKDLHPEFIEDYSLDDGWAIDFDEIEKVVHRMIDRLEYKSAPKGHLQQIVQMPLNMREFDVQDPSQKYKQQDALQDMTIVVEKNF